MMMIKVAARGRMVGRATSWLLWLKYPCGGPRRRGHVEHRNVLFKTAAKY